MKVLHFISPVALVFSLTACQQSSSNATSTANAAKTIQPTVVNGSNTLKVYNTYLELKDALVKSDRKATKAAAAKLSSNLSAIKGCNEAAGITRQIENSGDIKVQRENFSLLSNDIITLVKGAKLKTNAYVDYCPMANKGKGAYWLSASKNIENPYLQDMKECGELKEEIK